LWDDSRSGSDRTPWVSVASSPTLACRCHVKLPCVFLSSSYFPRRHHTNLLFLFSSSPKLFDYLWHVSCAHLAPSPTFLACDSFYCLFAAAGPLSSSLNLFSWFLLLLFVFFVLLVPFCILPSVSSLQLSSIPSHPLLCITIIYLRVRPSALLLLQSSIVLLHSYIDPSIQSNPIQVALQ